MDKTIRKCLTQSFTQVHAMIENQAEFDASLSGSTVVGIYQRGNTIYFANCGDSRAIVIGENLVGHQDDSMIDQGSDGSQNSPIVIMDQTRDQKPDCTDEVDRILNQYNGQINNTYDQTLVIQAIQGPGSVVPPKPSMKFGPQRIWVLNQTYPGLAMTRSLGDCLAKQAGVIAEPEITTFTYNPADNPQHQRVAPRWIVLASDGIWDVLSNEQVA